MRRTPPPVGILALSLVLTAAAVAAAPVSPTVALEPCAVPGLEEKARCGGLDVYENRASRAGRRRF
jgi:hypothetical protein